MRPYGTELFGEAFAGQAETSAVAIEYILFGEPNGNTYIARFNHTLHEEILNAYLFAHLDEVREVIDISMVE